MITHRKGSNTGDSYINKRSRSTQKYWCHDQAQLVPVKEEITVQKFGAVTRIGRYSSPGPETERKEYCEKYLDGSRQVFIA